MAEFVNPYTQLRQALAARQEAIANEAIPPMLSPEESEERRSKLSRNRMYGEMGVMSRDPGIGGVAKPMLEEAIKASQLKQTEHGEYDPTTGQFREFPHYTQRRKQELIDKQYSQTANLEAAATSRWDADRQRAAELAERQRERLENARTLRAMINANKTPTDPGSISYSGTHPETGMPILLHTKRGLGQIDPKTGEWKPYFGAVSQKDQGTTQGERKEISGAMDAHQGFDIAINMLKPLEKDTRTKITTGILPGALSAMGPVGQAIVQRSRSDEFNKAYQMVREISSGLRAGRFGMTLTPQEMADSIQYLPSGTDNVKDLILKAQGLQKIVKMKMDNMKKVTDKPGLPSRVPEMPGAADPNAYSDPEQERLYQEYKKSKGG